MAYQGNRSGGQGGAGGRGGVRGSGRGSARGAGQRGSGRGRASGSGRSGNARPQRANGRSGKAQGQRSDGSRGKGTGAARGYQHGNALRGGRERRNAPRDQRRAPSYDARRPGSETCIEGRRAVAEALRCGFPVKRAFIAQDAQADENLAQLLLELRQAGVPFKEVPRRQLDRLSSHGAHQGIVLETEPFPYVSLEDIIARAGEGPALVVVLDHVTDEGNFGAIVRSAEVVGAAGVVIASKRAASVGVGAYKTSAGAVMHLPIAQVPNLPAAVEKLKAAGFWVGGSSEHARESVWARPLTGRIALVMGSEGSGISRLMLEKCDFLVKLPQRGMTESLNVAQAATVMCYEWLRANKDALDGEGAPADKSAAAALDNAADADFADVDFGGSDFDDAVFGDDAFGDDFADDFGDDAFDDATFAGAGLHASNADLDFSDADFSDADPALYGLDSDAADTTRLDGASGAVNPSGEASA